MKEARIYVDFNELVEENLVLLSKTDIAMDSKGNHIVLKEGLHVKIYDEDTNDQNQEDNLVAEGVVERNIFGTLYKWTATAKWNCRIDENGIQNKSERNKPIGN